MSDVVKESELPKKLRDLYLRGTSAIELKNWSYAVSLFQAVLKEEPRFLDCRRLLRSAALRSNEGKKMKMGSEAIAAMKLAREVKKDPLGTLVLVEKEVLASDPHNAQGNQIVYEAAMAAEMPSTAGFALETLTEAHPNNNKYKHQLGTFFMEQEMFAEAAEVFSKIRQADPSDLVAIKMEKDATARESMRKGGWSRDANIRDLMHNKDEATKLEQQNRSGLTPEQLRERVESLLVDYAEDNNNLAVTRELASSYEQLEEFETSLSYYEWAHHLSGNDPALERKIADVREEIGRRQLRELSQFIEQYPDHPEIERVKEDHLQLKRTLSAKLIEESKVRVERNPTDMQLRFDYGKHLFDAGYYREAIPQLQAARKSPNLRIRGMNMLGQCMANLNMNDLAAAQFEEAAKEVPVMDDTKMELLYNLGLLYEKMGQKEKYLDALKQIYAASYDYKDVAQRVEASYQ